jgi:hypothetical protein
MISQFALSHSAINVAAPRRIAMTQTLAHTATREKGNVKTIGKKPIGKTASIRPEDIIPLDDETLKEF